MALFGLGRPAPAKEAPQQSLGWNQPILSKGILEIFADSVVGFVDGAVNRAVSGLDSVGNGITGAIGAGFERITSVSLGASHAAPEASPAVTQARAPEIAPARGMYDVDPAALFTFSAPNFNVIPLESRGVSQSASV